MEGNKDKSSRSGSKVNLNESTLPLLDDQEMEGKGDTLEREKIELEVKVEEIVIKEKEGDGAVEDGENSKSKKDKKDKKEKKKKEDKVKTHRRSVSCADTLTVGLNLLDRDERKVNDHVNLVFEDVLAEPDATQGFDGAWTFAFIVFSGTKHWVYRILAALLALPFGLIWGLVFSILTLINVWLFTPLLRTLDVIFYFIRRIWSGIIQTILDPLFISAGNLLGGININQKTTNQEIIKEP